METTAAKRNINASLTFTKKHLNDPQTFWDNVIWTDGSKVELFGQMQHFIIITSY